MVHLHNGMLCSKKKGAPTLHNNMDGSEEHYEISQVVKDKYDLIYKWNLIKKTIKQNITRDVEIKNKLTITRGHVGEGNGGKRERSSRNMDKAKRG